MVKNFCCYPECSCRKERNISREVTWNHLEKSGSRIQAPVKTVDQGILQSSRIELEYRRDSIRATKRSHVRERKKKEEKAMCSELCDTLLVVCERCCAPNKRSQFCGIKQRIQAAVKTVDQVMLQRSWTDLEYRLDIIRITKRSHVDFTKTVKKELYELFCP
ncbi:hypothetical protein AVEN_34213-1 [Araneus ventricosus]|uniref:Uncharacterized protein n=1 Tax=Araneus ventricosus TaxID=182803 RepID=A0A4Y2S9J1_ARAVE|nr:hypothetical protein AVEN_34213-1 [Araneus ventricosus]